MDKVISDIYITNEYNQFKLVSGNRKIRTNRKLEKSILEKGILTPIAVNSTLEILDGQHRFYIARKNGIELPYYVTVSKNIDDIIELNNTAHNWAVQDFINKYVDEEISDYIELNNVINRFKSIPLGDIISAALGNLNKSTKDIDIVKEGSFAFVNKEGFESILINFTEFIYKTGIKPVSGLFIAFFNISTIRKFELGSFIEKINDQDLKNKILGIRSGEKLFKMFIRAYNYGLQETSHKYIEYKVRKNRTIIILEERIPSLINL
ncbi:ParB N-terminal domain-containing protein [Enterococcus sp. AZ192]|uniref:ParB N-terminal domain-containing protein n=1 Tax=unclassified Enterococcus TaxID=2608891 RepID=UPI003D2CE04B